MVLVAGAVVFTVAAAVVAFVVIEALPDAGAAVVAEATGAVPFVITADTVTLPYAAPVLPVATIAPFL